MLGSPFSPKACSTRRREPQILDCPKVSLSSALLYFNSYIQRLCKWHDAVLREKGREMNWKDSEIKNDFVFSVPAKHLSLWSLQLPSGGTDKVVSVAFHTISFAFRWESHRTTAGFPFLGDPLSFAPILSALLFLTTHLFQWVIPLISQMRSGDEGETGKGYQKPLSVKHSLYTSSVMKNRLLQTHRPEIV